MHEVCEWFVGDARAHPKKAAATLRRNHRANDACDARTLLSDQGALCSVADVFVSDIEDRLCRNKKFLIILIECIEFSQSIPL
jgi:hypothetical protein